MLSYCATSPRSSAPWARRRATVASMSPSPKASGGCSAVSAWSLALTLTPTPPLTGDYPAAAASQQQALALCRDLGNLEGQAEALSCLGVVQQESGDYP